MDIELAEHAAHAAYINHIMPCRSCYAPTKRYCFVGKSLLVDYEAHFFMRQDLHARRKFLAQLEALDPEQYEATKARMLWIHEQLHPPEE